MIKCMIAAVADNYGIGVKGDLPWHLPEDLKYFKSVTSGFPVIMGRTTYFSIGKPLPGRLNIVLNAGGDPIEGVFTALSFDDAYGIADISGKEKCFVIGGASVYAAAINDMDLLYITHVHTEVADADAFFPVIDKNIWEVESSTPSYTDPQTGWKYEFVVYRKKQQ